MSLMSLMSLMLQVNSSWTNYLEAQLALAIVKLLLTKYCEQLSPAEIGIITPYNGQVKHIRSLFKETFDREVASQIDVNSVDGFQGREKSVIILSTVRSDYGRGDDNRGIGFVKDARRINVSMTRAKHSLFILGHAETLETAPLWEALVGDARKRKCYIRASSPIGMWFDTAVRERAVIEVLEPPEKATGHVVLSDEVPAKGPEHSAQPTAEEPVSKPPAAKRARRGTGK